MSVATLGQQLGAPFDKEAVSQIVLDLGRLLHPSLVVHHSRPKEQRRGWDIRGWQIFEYGPFPAL